MRNTYYMFVSLGDELSVMTKITKKQYDDMLKELRADYANTDSDTREEQGIDSIAPITRVVGCTEYKNIFRVGISEITLIWYKYE